MGAYPQPLPIAAFAVLTAGVVLGGCSGTRLPNFSGGGEPAAPPPSAAVPSKYSPEELVGRWGYTSYQNEADKARTVNSARGLCRNPYVIARGPSGGVMMHLPDQRQPSELRLKGSSDGKNYIGPDGEAGGAQDREIVSFDGRVLIARYVDPDAANRYGNQVYVRCAASGRG
jgi:hypothetical protein